MKKKTTRILQLIYLAAIFFATFLAGYFFTRGNNLDFFGVIGGQNIFWFLAAVGGMVVYWAAEAWILNYLTGLIYGKERFWHSVKMNMIGQYYSALIPFGHGQPIQVVYMKRDGMPVGIATIILIVKFIVFEIIIFAYCILCLAIRAGFYYSNYHEVFWFTIIGLLINGVVLAAAILAIVKNVTTKKIILAITRFLHRIRLVRHLEKAELTVTRTLDDLYSSSKYVKQYKGKLVIAGLITVLQYIGFFSIPYFLYCAFGHGVLFGPNPTLGAALDEALNIFVMTAFLFLAVCFFPTPGTTGASETGFGIFFSRFFPADWASAMFIWRVITYYSNIIIGFIIIFIDGFTHKGAPKEITENGQNSSIGESPPANIEEGGLSSETQP